MPSAPAVGRTRVLLAAGLLAVPPVVGAFVSTGWSWGWDHLHRAPRWWAWLLAALALLACLPPLARRFWACWARLGEWLGRHRWIGPLVLAAVSAAVFAAFPIATRLYGDSLTSLNRHTPADLARHLRELATPLLGLRGSAVALLHDVLERLTGLPYERCFQIVSVVCGGCFVFAHARLAASVPGVAGWARLAIVWLGLTDGANQLFFGHVERYTVPRLFACLFLMRATGSLLAEHDRPPRAVVFLLLFVAMGLHPQWAVLLPAGLLLAGRELARTRPRLRPWTGARAAAGGVGAMVVVLAGVYAASGATCYDYLYTGGRPELRQIFLPIQTACVGLPQLRYTLFSGAHLLDLAGSLYSISSPAVLLVLALLLVPLRRAPGLVVLLPAVAAALVHNLLINPSIGLPFDWDLLCVASPPLLYTAVYLVAVAGRAERASADGRGVPTVAPASPVWTLPLVLLGLTTATLFGVNASRDAVYRRVEDMAVWMHRTYHGGSHYRLSANLSTIADPTLQERERMRVLERLTPQTYPQDGEVAFLWERLGLDLAERGEYAAALEAYRTAMRLEPDRWLRKRQLGWLETKAGDEEHGLQLLLEYLQMAPEDADIWGLVGDVQAQRGDLEPARDAWERSLRLRPDGPTADYLRQRLQQFDEGGGGAPARGAGR